MIPLLVVVATFFISQALGEATQVVTSKALEYSVLEEDEWPMGELIEVQTQPWIASIQNGAEHVCAGSVVSPSLVLTAAGCTERGKQRPAKLSVRVGCSIAQRGGSVHEVVRSRRHEQYDVALLELSPPIEFGRDAQPIGYANRADSLAANSSASVAGWAADSRRVGSMLLRSAELRVLGRSGCANLAGDERICLGGGPACQGDPGGPLVADRLQFGVVPSAGLGCVSSARPGLVTNLAPLRPWIDASVAALQADNRPTTLADFMEKYVLPMFWPFNQF